MGVITRLSAHLFDNAHNTNDSLWKAHPHYAVVTQFWPYLVATGVVFELLFTLVSRQSSNSHVGLLLEMFGVVLLLSLLPMRSWIRTAPVRYYFEFTMMFALPFLSTSLVILSGFRNDAVLFHFCALVIYCIFANPVWSLLGFGLSATVSFVAFGADISLFEGSSGVYGVLLTGLVLVACMSLVMRLLSFAMQRTVQLQRQQKRNDVFFNSLMVVSTKVTQSRSIHEAFETALSALSRVFPEAGFALYVEDPDRQLLLAYQSTGLTTDESALIRDEVRSLPVSAVPEVAEQETWKKGSGAHGSHYAERRPQLFLGGNMVFRSGGVSVTRLMKFAVFGEIVSERRNMLEVFNEQLIGICRQIVQAEEIERIAHTDSLTGLFNRSYYEKMFPWLTSESLISQVPLTLVFCDVNGLKKINDDFGHHEGDKLIREAARAIRESCRRNDLVFRLGGDEIVILCPGTTLENAEILINRISAATESATIMFVDEAAGRTLAYKVQLSIGAASTETVAPAELLLAADKQMLANKETFYRQNVRYR
jgi:diguanylate cyclase (GGDEF)-like protein